MILNASNKFTKVYFKNLEYRFLSYMTRLSFLKKKEYILSINNNHVGDGLYFLYTSL